MSAPSPELRLPNKEDPRLLAILGQCGDLFRRFARCSRRAMSSAKESTAYGDLIAQAAQADGLLELTDAPMSVMARKLKRRADNVLIMAMVRECGYVRAPLKDCLAIGACSEEREVRDRYLSSRPDLVTAVKTTPSDGSAPIDVSSQQQAELAKMAVMEKRIEDCIRRYQFAMNISYIHNSDSFDPARLDNVQVEVVRPGQL